MSGNGAICARKQPAAADRDIENVHARLHNIGRVAAISCVHNARRLRASRLIPILLILQGMKTIHHPDAIQTKSYLEILSFCV
jgi:hypothetical protein